MSYAPPAMVVLAWRPTTERPIRGAVLATISKISAVMVSARGRPMGSALRVAIVQPQRGQRALPPGGRGGMHWSRSQSGQATVSIDKLGAAFDQLKNLDEIFHNFLLKT